MSGLMQLLRFTMRQNLFCNTFKRFRGILLAALAMTFAGVAYAVPDVGIAVLNELDSNGNITVIEGDTIRVSYTTIDDPDKDVDKKDRIILRRLSDDSIVDFAFRGSKKTNGAVSLKAKKAAGEQLYVEYQRKGKNGTVLATEHNTVSDPNATPLVVIDKASIKDLTIGLNALTTTVTRYYVAGINDFVPFRESYTYSRNDSQLNPSSDGAVYFFAPVHLPGGATITAIDVYIFDNSSTSTINWNLRERALATGSINATIATVNGDNAGTPGNTTLSASGLSHVVDNSQYYYQIRLHFTDGDTSPVFRSARITYEVDRPD